MAVSPALRRLHRVLEIEEEQCRLALESALGSLARLEHAHAAASQRQRRGRRLVVSSAGSAETADRLAGLEETRAGSRHATALAPRIAEAEQEVATQRQAYLAKRVERRQAETLIRETEARDTIEAGRRGQRTLDDWFLSRVHHAGQAADQAADQVLNLSDASPPAVAPQRDKIPGGKT